MIDQYTAVDPIVPLAGISLIVGFLAVFLVYGIKLYLEHKRDTLPPQLHEETPQKGRK